jgi:hypothetical protein
VLRRTKKAFNDVDFQRVPPRVLPQLRRTLRHKHGTATCAVPRTCIQFHVGGTFNRKQISSQSPSIHSRARQPNYRLHASAATSTSTDSPSRPVRRRHQATVTWRSCRRGWYVGPSKKHRCHPSVTFPVLRRARRTHRRLVPAVPFSLHRRLPRQTIMAALSSRDKYRPCPSLTWDPHLNATTSR